MAGDNEADLGGGAWIYDPLAQAALGSSRLSKLFQGGDFHPSGKKPNDKKESAPIYSIFSHSFKPE
jgi:hypothetical protein